MGKTFDRFVFDDRFFLKSPSRLHAATEDVSLMLQLRVFERLRTRAPHVAALPMTMLSFASEAGTHRVMVDAKARFVFDNKAAEGYTVGVPAKAQMVAWLRLLHAAVTSLHKAGVVHLDLHPNNTMFKLKDGEVAHVILIDLDSALVIDGAAPMLVAQDVVDHVQRGAWRNAYPDVLVAGQPAPPEADWYFVGALLLAHLRGEAESWVKGPSRAVALDELKAMLEQNREALQACARAVRAGLQAGVENLRDAGLIEDGVGL
jgi:hypothetical protein